MKIIDHGRTAMQWLAGQGISVAGGTEILSTFRGVPSVCVYRAPHLFLRAHGRASTKPVFAANYWADGSALASAFERADQFQGFLTDDEIRQVAKNYYREITAISRNWNELASVSFWRITLCGSETVEGIEGPVAPQPVFSADKRTGEAASASMLAGGGLQVFLNPKTPFICTPVDW